MVLCSRLYKDIKIGISLHQKIESLGNFRFKKSLHMSSDSAKVHFSENAHIYDTCTHVCAEIVTKKLFSGHLFSLF